MSSAAHANFSAGVSTVARERRRGSVLVIVMVTLLFATVALIAFMEKAGVDLMVDEREVLTKRLRMEAYSALEVTLGVLSEFREVGQGLHSPAEGWGDPLGFANYSPSEDRRVEITFEDESGKLSLPHATAPVLTNLFKNWGLQQNDAESLADALLGWMKRDHVYATALTPDYEQGAIPYEPPLRSLRSYSELAAIDKAREVFYDADGRPNDLWKRFADSISLLDFPRPNINGAKSDTLAALGQFDETQQQNLLDYRRGTGSYQAQGPQYFRTANEAGRIANGDVNAFGSTISALRIFVTVREGRSEFRLAAVVAPPGSGAKTVQETATSTRTQTSASTSQTAAQQQARPNAAQANARQNAGTSGQNANTRNLKYPFTLLEIRENDEIPAAPPAPAADSLI